MSQTDVIEVRPALSLPDTVQELLETRRVDAALDWLGTHSPHAIADQLARMDD